MLWHTAFWTHLSRKSTKTHYVTSVYVKVESGSFGSFFQTLELREEQNWLLSFSTHSASWWSFKNVYPTPPLQHACKVNAWQIRRKKKKEKKKEREIKWCAKGHNTPTSGIQQRRLLAPWRLCLGQKKLPKYSWESLCQKKLPPLLCLKSSPGFGSHSFS